MTNTNLNILGDKRTWNKIPNLAEQIEKEVEEKERKKAEKERKGKAETQDEKAEEKQEEEEQITPIITAANIEPADYILLEGKSYGSYSYDDLVVCKYKLGLVPEVQQTARQLRITVQNTAKEKNGREYIGEINQQEALKLNLLLGGFTLVPRQFWDFYKLLKSGKAFDGKGNKITKGELERIFNEIAEEREPWRGEWLDADFKYLDVNENPVNENEPNGEQWIYYEHKLEEQNGQKILVPKRKERLEICLMNDCLASFNSLNYQGLPTKKGKDFSYWFPRKDNNSVAGFDAGSDRASLNCNRYPSNRDASLGVRLCVPKAHTQKT